MTCAAAAMMLNHFSHVWLFGTPWIVAYQAPLCIGFSKQEYWSGLPCPPPGDLPNSKTELLSPVSPALAGGFFTSEPPGPVQIKSFWVHSNTVYMCVPHRWVHCGKDKVSAQVSVRAWPSFLNTEAKNEKDGEKYFSLIYTPGLYTIFEYKVFISETHIHWISNLGPVLYLMLGTEIKDSDIFYDLIGYTLIAKYVHIFIIILFTVLLYINQWSL